MMDSSRLVFSSTSLMTTGISLRPAMRAALQRRSPATISYSAPLFFTTIGDIIP